MTAVIAIGFKTVNGMRPYVRTRNKQIIIAIGTMVFQNRKRYETLRKLWGDDIMTAVIAIGFKTVNGMRPYVSELIDLADNGIIGYEFQNRKRYETLRKKTQADGYYVAAGDGFKTVNGMRPYVSNLECHLSYTKLMKGFKTVNGMRPYVSLRSHGGSRGS